jgi:hypothetical protein
VLDQFLLSFDVIIISIRTINFRSVSMKFGVLVIMVEQMMSVRRPCTCSELRAVPRHLRRLSPGPC